jgi:hypothetical protein
MTFDALSFDFKPPSMDSLMSKKLQVEIDTNPQLVAKINIDGHLYTTPTSLQLQAGAHTLTAISQVQDGPLGNYVIYVFNCWIINGKCVGYMPTLVINIKDSASITAQYMLGEGNWGSPTQPDSLPNPTGPMTPSLITNNSRQNILNSDPRTKEV